MGSCECGWTLTEEGCTGKAPSPTPRSPSSLPPPAPVACFTGWWAGKRLGSWLPYWKHLNLWAPFFPKVFSGVSSGPAATPLCPCCLCLLPALVLTADVCRGFMAGMRLALVTAQAPRCFLVGNRWGSGSGRFPGMCVKLLTPSPARPQVAPASCVPSPVSLESALPCAPPPAFGSGWWVVSPGVAVGVRETALGVGLLGPDWALRGLACREPPSLAPRPPPW